MKPAIAAPRILVVEDEPLVLEIAVEDLRDAGFDVVGVSDGEGAIDALRTEGRFDLLFTDIRMPGSLDGWSVAAAARALQPSIAVIYATGFSEQEPGRVERSVLLKKPYRVKTIIETARTLGVAANGPA